MDDPTDDIKKNNSDRVLSAREKRVVEVERQFRRTRDRIEQIEARALRKLNRPQPTD